MKPQYFFWIVFTITSYFMFELYKPFVMNIVVSLLLCVSTFGLKNYISKYIKYNFISSLVTLIVFLACFIIPLIFVVFELIKELLTIDINALTSFISISKVKIIGLLEHLPSTIKTQALSAITAIDTNTIASHILNISTIIGKASINFVTDLSLMVIFLYLYYYYGSYLKQYIIDIIPFQKQDSSEIIQEVAGVLKVVFFTTISSMILQGISFGVIAKIFGLSGILFGTLYAITSIIPVVGGGLVWVPVGLYLYWQGKTFAAIFISIYSLVFIGFIVDNVVKPILINVLNKLILDNPVNINEMIIFISILAGLASFGFWGIIIGPTISAFFLALIRMYQTKFKNQ